MFCTCELSLFEKIPSNKYALRNYREGGKPGSFQLKLFLFIIHCLKLAISRPPKKLQTSAVRNMERKKRSLSSIHLFTWFEAVCVHKIIIYIYLYVSSSPIDFEIHIHLHVTIPVHLAVNGKSIPNFPECRTTNKISNVYSSKYSPNESQRRMMLIQQKYNVRTHATMVNVQLNRCPCFWMLFCAWTLISMR